MKLPLRLSIALFVIPFLASCGGGGGGGNGSSGATLHYRSDWSNRSRAVTGLSQQITIYNTSEIVVSQKTMDQSADGVQEVSFSNLSNGAYRVQADLYSGHDLAGSITGTSSVIVNVSGSTTVTTEVGSDIESIQVTPLSVTVRDGDTKQFAVTALTAGAVPTFVDSDDIDWSVSGGIGSINSSGIFTATTVGWGNVKATYDPEDIEGQSNVDVTNATPATAKWTILVFLNAANDLMSFADLNVNQMETVAGNPDVQIVLQWKEVNGFSSEAPRFIGTRRYLVKQDTKDTIASELVQDMGTDVDMGDDDTLEDFIDWGKEHYPAERYCLVIWNHGNGWHRSRDDMSRAVSYDDETGHAIQAWELDQAIGSNHMDIIAFDASLMQMIEVATELKDTCDYVVGSEESPPGEGYPYQRIFDNFRDNPDGSTLNLSKAFVDGMLDEPDYNARKITQSVIDTSKINALNTAISGLSDALAAGGSEIAPAVQNARAFAKAYSLSSTRYYFDLYDVCTKLSASLPSSQTSVAAANVQAAISNAVVWEGHNSNSAGSHGVAIDFSPASRFNTNTYANDYANLQFAGSTSWNEWLAVAP